MSRPSSVKIINQLDFSVFETNIEKPQYNVKSVWLDRQRFMLCSGNWCQRVNY